MRICFSRDGRTFLRGPAIFLLLFLFIAGCGRAVRPSLQDFSGYQDGPLPADALVWLEPGAQSRITRQIADEAAKIHGRTRRERLFRGMDLLWKRFRYDRWYNDRMFALTSDELFTSNVLGGCSDFGLVEGTFFRALSIPARIVVTADVDWISSYRKDPLAMTRGHTFIEVFLEDRWYLVDSTYRLLYSGYRQGSAFFPHNQLYCSKGKDYWEMGIRSIADLDAFMKGCTGSYVEGSYREPIYSKEPI